MDKRTVLIRLDLDAQLVGNVSGQQAPLAIVGKQFRWTGTDADLVELIYALKGVNNITADGRPADIKDLAELFGGCFGKELPNVYWTGMANQKRKKDKTPFLNRLIRVLVGDVEEEE
jgi:RteC protein